MSQFLYDPAADQEALQQKRALIQALQQASQQAPQMGQMVSGHYVGNPLAAVMPVLQAYRARSLGNEFKQEQAAAGERYQSALAQGLEKYFSTREGKPGQTMSDQQAADLMLNDQAPQLAEPVQADPRRAMIEAMTSNLPPLQQLGAAELQGMMKGRGEETFSNPVTERGPNGQPISVQYGNRGTRRVIEGAMPYEKPITVADRVVDPFAPDKPLANYEVTGGPVKTDERGDKYQLMSNGKWVKLDNAPKINVGGPQINLPGQKAGFEEWSKLAAKTVSELGEQARGSVKMLTALNQLESSDASGVFSGPTSGPAQFLSGLGKSLGLPVDSNKLANSQTFAATAQQAVQAMIANLGGNRAVTEKEAIQIAQSAPSLLQSREGRAQITAYLRSIAQRQIEEAKQAQAEYSKALTAQDPATFTFGLSSAQLPITQAVPPSPGAVNSPQQPTRSGW